MAERAARFKGAEQEARRCVLGGGGGCQGTASGRAGSGEGSRGESERPCAVACLLADGIRLLFRDAVPDDIRPLVHQRPYKQLMSPLKYQTRTVAAFPNKQGYLVGSIEGRVAVNHVEESASSKNFTFKCHREQADIYSVNDIKFHPTHGTFVTCGSDGVFNFWDKDSKQRLKQMAKCNAPIPCGDFNRDGSIFAYAVSYDWSKGGADPAAATGQNNIFLHAVTDTEVQPRPPQSRTGRR